jgi:RHS repeat-associated protein
MHRSTRFVATLLLAPLLAQSLLASAVFLPFPQIASAASAVALAKTGKDLPSASDRLGGKAPASQSAAYAKPASTDETGPLDSDGSFRLPKQYVPNPDAPDASAPAKEHGKPTGPSPMSLTVNADVTTNTTWTLANSPYIVSGTVNVQSPAVLTIEPGVIVKFDTAASLLVQAGATMNADGTTAAPISFTSLKDDSIGGDTNGDGSATAPALGDWATLGYTGYFDTSGHAAFGSLTHALVHYGQQVSVRFSMPTLQDDTIEHMSGNGLYLDTVPSSTYTIQRLTLTDNQYHVNMYAVPSTTEIKDSVMRASRFIGVQGANNTAAKLTNNSIDYNAGSGFFVAVKSYSSPMLLRYNSIAMNRRSSDGLARGLEASGATVDAQYNWWGSTSGPAVDDTSDTGGGSSVSSSYVTYTNWLGSAFEPDHKRGNAPWEAKAGVGIDAASGNFTITHTDLSIPTIGFPLEITRTYNNQAATTAGGDFGAGWTWTYGTNLNLTADTYGGVVWEKADGAKNYFKKSPDGVSFTPEEGVFEILTYDAGSSTYTIRQKDQSKLVFDSNGRLIQQIDTDGNTTVIARDGTGKIQTITEPTGRALTVTYTGSQITLISDPLSRTYVYAYTAGTPNAIQSVTRKASDGSTFASCSYGYSNFLYALTTVSDCDGNTIAVTYDSSKRVLTQTVNSGTPIHVTYGPGTDATTGLTFAAGSTGIYDQRGKTHVYYYTKGNKVFEKWRENYIQSGTYFWYYEDLWSYLGYLQTSHRDIDQKTTTYKWDAAGNLLEETAPGSRKTTSTYDSFNNKLSSKDNLNRETDFAYDAEQHLTTVTDPLTRTTTTTYTTAGLPLTVTDAKSKVTSFTYDSWGYPATVTNAANETLTFHYDAAGRKLWEETPTSKRTTYTYNDRGEVLTVTDPLNNVTTTVYDTKGRKTSVTDAENHTTTFTYRDPQNNLWKTTDAANGVVEFAYDGLGNLTQVKDALLHTTDFTYDTFNRKISETDFANKTTNWEYKPSGLLTKVTDPLNQATIYTYDSINNDLTGISYADSKTVSQTFDGVGNRLTMTDWNGAHSYTYDALNRVLTATDHLSQTVSYSYDEVGNLATLTYPGSKVVTYTYDDARRLKTITDWASRVTTYTYDSAGRLGSFVLPNGVTTTYGYDDASRAQHLDDKLGATTIASNDYTFDHLGNRKTKVDASGTETYTYDALYRVTNVVYPSTAQTAYTYDATGNRLTKVDASGTTTYTYDSLDQLTNAGDGTRTYDVDGQLLTVGANLTYGWDARQQLASITRGGTNTAPTANAGANQTGFVGRLVTLDGSASSDPQGDQLRFTWTEGGSNPASNVLHGKNAPKPGFVPTVTGTYTFSLVVNDGTLNSSSSSVTVTVGASTQTASATPATGMSGFVDSADPTGQTFTGTFMKVGRNATTRIFMGAAQFALPTKPAGMDVAAATLTLTGKTSSSNASSDQWSVRLLPTSVDANWATTSYNTVSGATPDRTLSPVLTGLNQVLVDTPNTWTFGSSDLAVLTARYAGSGKLSIREQGDSLGASSQVQWYSGEAGAAKKPKLSLTFTAPTIPDQTPIARAGVDASALTNSLVTLNGSASYDYEDSSVTYAWTANAGNPAGATLSSTTVASPTFTPTAAGTYRFSLVVTDSQSHASTSDEVIITVTASSLPQNVTYVYDGNGDRIKQTVDSVVTDYVQNSIPDNEQVLMETTAGVTTYYVYGHDLLYSIVGTTPHYHHTDTLGSTIAVTDASGAVEQTMSYDIFGNMRSMTGTSKTKYTFTGEENDVTGLVYLRARYYDPAVGRFLSRDPFPMKVADTQSVNRYAYVKNNPTNYVDPAGEQAIGVLEGIGIGSAALVLLPFLQQSTQKLSDAVRRAVAGPTPPPAPSGPRFNGKPGDGGSPRDPSKFIKYGTGPLLMRLGADHANSGEIGHDWDLLRMTAIQVENFVASTLNNAAALSYGDNQFNVSIHGYILSFYAHLYSNGMVSVGTWWISTVDPLTK